MTAGGGLPRAYYFGCWRRAGHGLHHVGGLSVHPRDGVPFDPFRGDGWLDGALAPRRSTGRCFGLSIKLAPNEVFCAVRGQTPEERRRLHDHGAECQQGEYLLHHLRGHTLMAWWDRVQGDDRGACNSVFIVEGALTADEMLALWPKCFPEQATNLERAGVVLREVA